MATAVLGLIGTVILALGALLGTLMKIRVDRTAAELARDNAKREHEVELETIRAQKDVELEAARIRVEQVDGPASNAEAWSQVFAVTNDAMLRLQADVARLQQRLDDQDVEHRMELEDRDKQLHDMRELCEHTADSLRRLRSYVAVVTDLLATHDIAFPPPPASEHVAPERRGSNPPGVAITAVVQQKKGHT